MTLNSIINRLQPRQQQVVACIVAGCPDKETARQLGLSPRTIETYRERIRRTLGARNTADIVRIALRGK